MNNSSSPYLFEFRGGEEGRIGGIMFPCSFIEIANVPHFLRRDVDLLFPCSFLAVNVPLFPVSFVSCFLVPFLELREEHFKVF